MKTTTTLIRIASAALATSLMFAATAASAADSNTKTELPRVLVTGKSAGPAPVVQQLPRVVVSGLSVNTQMQQLMLAAAKSDGKAARRNG